MKKIINLSFAVLSFVSIVSCSDDDAVADTTKPTVNIISPTDHQEIEPGTTLNFKAALADNVGLKSYKIEIHSAEDGHEHKGNTTFGADFEYHVTNDVPNAAKSFEVNQAISIPADVTEEHYHVGITVLDINGNQNQQFVEVFIGHDDTH